MDELLRRAWTGGVEARDYEEHMAAIGQAQANAELVAETFRKSPPAAGSAVLFAGSGPGQAFTYTGAEYLMPYRTTFADIHAEFLRLLAQRLRDVPGLVFETVEDDLEETRLTGPFALAIAVLVLEHVNWQRAVADLCRLARRVFVVVQENPPDMAEAVTPTRTLPGSLAQFRDARPHLIDRGELQREFGCNGFTLRRAEVREVADSKKMIGLEFERVTPVE